MNKDQVGVDEFLQFVESVSEYLDEKTLSEAKDIEFGQWEVPFEGILLSLMKLSRRGLKVDFELAARLAKEADITESGVLDIDTWKRFLNWSK